MTASVRTEVAAPHRLAAPGGNEQKDGDGSRCSDDYEIQCKQDGHQSSAPFSTCFPQPGSNPVPTALDHRSESDSDELVKAHPLPIGSTCQFGVERFGHPQEKPATVRASSAAGLLVGRLRRHTGWGHGFQV